MSIQARDIMVSNVITIRKDSTLEEAVELMNKHEIGCLIVTENEKPVGIITERDFLKRVLAKSQDPKKTMVDEVMSTPLISVESSIEIAEASKLMFQKNIKKMPVVEKDKLLGLVTLTDILRIQPQLIKMYKVFTSDHVPRRMRKVFDYYLLVDNKPDCKIYLSRNPSSKKPKTT